MRRVYLQSREKPYSLIGYLNDQSADLIRLSRVVFIESSPSAIHRLRITIRRIRASLWILKKSSPEIHFKALDRNLSQLGKRLGAVRELDVAIKDAKNYELDSSSLKSKRKKKFKEVCGLLKTRQQTERSKQLDKLIGMVDMHDDLNLNHAWVVLQSRVTSLVGPNIFLNTRLHRFRISIKKIRYSLEAGGRPTQQLHTLQNCLGKIHDLEILQKLLGKRAAIKRSRHALDRKARHLAKPAIQAALNEVDALVHLRASHCGLSMNP